MHAQAAVDTAAKEIRALSLALLRGVENPELFPPHVQRLHALATKVQEERARRGIPQNALDARSFPLENAQRVVYAVYDRRSPQLFYLASREPPGIDLRGLFLMSLRNRNNKLLDYLARTDFSMLGIYPLESIARPGVPFSVISKARLAFWRAVTV